MRLEVVEKNQLIETDRMV